MTRHAVVFLAALALVAGACSGSGPEGFEPPPTPVLAATSTPAPSATATATPVPEPTATAAPTATPAPSDEELAVIAAWERYVVLVADVRTKDPSPAALDFESYMVDGALDGSLSAQQSDREEGRYIAGPVETTVTNVAFLPEGDAVVDACTVTDYVAYSLTDNSVLFEEDEIQYAALARLVLRDGTWRVAAKQSEIQPCEL